MADTRPEWNILMPLGGWGPPWPQAVELLQVMPSTQWTLVGGLMIQLHAAYAAMDLTRATLDIDMVLHVETGAVVFADARAHIEGLGYDLQLPAEKDGNIHRFLRTDGAQIDVMIADRLPAHLQQRAMGHNVFAVPAGTSALRKTVSCVVDPGDGTQQSRFSMPDVLGALVLKGAAYKADSRERERHLDDAALLACAMEDPEVEKPRLEGSDRGRIQMLYAALEDPSHRSWLAFSDARRTHGQDCLRILSANPQAAPARKGLGRKA